MERIFKVSFFLVIILIVMTVAVRMYGGFHQQIPKDTDQFGYLNLARAIEEGRVFEHHVSRPFFPELLEFLRNEKIDPKLYSDMIVSHAYHLIEGRVINQYPPGTSLLLSSVPLEFRQILFPALVIGMLAAPFFLLALIKKISFKEAISLFLFCSLIVFYFEPLSLELSRVNSVAPTLGLLVAAGLVAPSVPVLSIALVSFSVLFRVINMILIVPLVFVYLRDQFGHSGRAIGKEGIKVVALILLSGVGLYLVYLTFLTGSPFVSSYGAGDKEFIPLKGFARSVSFYLDITRPWFLAHIVILVALFLSSLRRGKGYSLFYAALLLSVVNYLFFLTHKVRVSYYPYASACVSFGMLLHLWLPFFRTRIAYQAQILIIAMMLFVSINDSSVELSVVRDKFTTDVQGYKEAFRNYDVIWAGLGAGTIEYAAGKPSFRYHWGDASVRKKIISWLSSNGYRQAVWLSDARMNEKEAIGEIEGLELRAGIISSTAGQILQVK